MHCVSLQLVCCNKSRYAQIEYTKGFSTKDSFIVLITLSKLFYSQHFPLFHYLFSFFSTHAFAFSLTLVGYISHMQKNSYI